MRKRIINAVRLLKKRLFSSQKIKIILKRNKKSFQTLPQDLFRRIQRKYPAGHGEFLIANGVFHILTPTVVCPILMKVRQKKIQMSIGLHSDHDVMTFYLFTIPFPYESKEGTVLLEIKGGKMEGIGPDERKFTNATFFWQGKRKICARNNYSLAIGRILDEMGGLVESGKYLIEEEVPKEKIQKLSPFLEKNYAFVYKIEY